MALNRELGTLVRWVDARTFGFIRPDDPDSPDVFCHLHDFSAPPSVGWRVRYTPMMTDRGARASNVEVLAEPGGNR